MTKEIYISSTPHETRLAVVEDDQLAEIYYERENEYTLAGSVYKGRVTRVLPGMQSAFVDVGLERDAFLYVTDFAEEQEDGEEYVSLPQGNGRTRAIPGTSGGRNADPTAASTGQVALDENGGRQSEEEKDEQTSSGARRWRGRRGRRRGRGGSRHESSAKTPDNAEPSSFDQDGADFPLSIEPMTETELPESETSSEQGNRTRDEHADLSAESSSTPSDRAIQLPIERRHARGETHLPSVLPGESISKYRRGSAPSASPEQAAHGESAAASTGSRGDAAKPPAPAFHPSTMVVAPLKWDGGNLLPGESISRYKKAPPAHAPSEEAAANATALESGPETPSAGTSVGDPRSRGSEEPESEPQVEPEAKDADSSTPREEEPSSASYRFDPSGPSAYRQSGVIEPVETDDIEDSGLEASHEAASEETATESEIYSADPDDTGSAAASPSPDFSKQEDDTSAAFESESEDRAATESGAPAADSADSRYRVFNPGEGQLEEETIDEEDTDQVPVEARAADEEYDDLIEETIESQLDSGLIGDVVRDRYIDR
jgi:ribonuclease G